MGCTLSLNRTFLFNFTKAISLVNVTSRPVQVNLCQKLLFLQNKGRTCCVHKLFWISKTISVHNMFSPWSELGIFMYWTCNSMNNLSSYCGLADAKKELLTKIYLIIVKVLANLLANFNPVFLVLFLGLFDPFSILIILELFRFS